MKSFRSAKSPNRALITAVALAALMLLALAPSAMAWHGYLRVKKVVVDTNTTRKASADFDFTVDRQDTPPSGTWSNNIVDVPFLSNGETWTSASWASGGDSNPSVPWKRFKVTEIAATGANAQALANYETSIACGTPWKYDNGENSANLWNVQLPNTWGAWPPATPQSVASGTNVTSELRWDGTNGGYVTQCVFTNTRKPTIKVKKLFPNNPFGDTQKVKIKLGASDLTNTVTNNLDFGDGGTSAAIPLALNAGSQTIAETASGNGNVNLAKYVKTISCVDDFTHSTIYSTTLDSASASWSVPALSAGQDVTCTITNRRVGGHLTLKKLIVPSTDKGQFDLSAGDNTTGPLGSGESQTFDDIAAGDYKLSEVASEGTAGDRYQQTGLACSRDSSGAQPLTATNPLNGDTVTVKDGESITCMFTNTKKSTIKLVKEFKLGGEPYNSPDSVTLKLNGESKSVTGIGGATSTQTVAGGSTSTVSEEFSSPEIAALYNAGEPVCVDQNDETVSTDGGQVVVPPGADVVCTIINRRNTGRLTLRKLIVPSTDSAKFVLNAGSYATEPLGNDQNQSFGNVPTGSYKLGETAQEGYDLTKTECVYNGVDSIASPSDVAGPPANPLDENGNVIVSDGTDITCTLTNTKRGTVTIKKVTTDSSTGVFSFTGDLNGFDVKGGGEKSFSVEPGKTYTVTESPAVGYTLDSLSCSDHAQGEGASTVAGAVATIDVQAGESVTCTFTNKPVEVPPTIVPPGGGVSPVPPSGGATTPKAGARLSGTVGCAARTSSASIKGKLIKRVTFYLDGKKVKTVNGTEGKGTVTFRYIKATRSLGYGSHRLVAKVQFFASSKASPRTYRLTFSRCKPRLVKPKFTG